MKATVNGVQVEGTPMEIAQYVQGQGVVGATHVTTYLQSAGGRPVKVAVTKVKPSPTVKRKSTMTKEERSAKIKAGQRKAKLKRAREEAKKRKEKEEAKEKKLLQPIELKPKPKKGRRPGVATARPQAVPEPEEVEAKEPESDGPNDLDREG